MLMHMAHNSQSLSYIRHCNNQSGFISMSTMPRHHHQLCCTKVPRTWTQFGKTVTVTETLSRRRVPTNDWLYQYLQILSKASLFCTHSNSISLYFVDFCIVWTELRFYIINNGQSSVETIISVVRQLVPNHAKHLHEKKLLLQTLQVPVRGTSQIPE